MEIIKAVSDLGLVLGLVAIVMAPRVVAAHLVDRWPKYNPVGSGECAGSIDPGKIQNLEHLEINYGSQLPYCYGRAE